MEGTQSIRTLDEYLNRSVVLADGGFLFEGNLIKTDVYRISGEKGTWPLKPGKDQVLTINEGPIFYLKKMQD